VRPAAVPQRAPAEAFARTAAEERLRRGHVSVRGEQLIKFETLLRSSPSALSGAQEVLNRLRVPREVIPELPSSAPHLLRVLAVDKIAAPSCASRESLSGTGAV
jgi:hypothetical protein